MSAPLMLVLSALGNPVFSVATMRWSFTALFGAVVAFIALVLPEGRSLPAQTHYRVAPRFDTPDGAR